MAESNRTERRLLDSIRKAKTGPGDDTAEDASTSTDRSTPTMPTLAPAPATNRAAIRAEGAGATTDRHASSRARSSPSKSSTSGPASERPDTGLAGGRSAGRRATTHKITARPPEPPKKTAQATASMDRYQSGRRVWPD
jgi:hypothetical protein